MTTVRALFLAVCCVSTAAQALEPAATFDEANRAYLSGDATAAAAKYRTLVEAGHATGDVLFNLGTAELKAGRRGWATLWFERALQADPEDEDVAFNLAEAQKANVDKVVGEREEMPFVERLGARVPPWMPGAFAIAWAAALLSLFVRRHVSRGRAVLGVLGVLALVVSLPAGALTGAAAWRASKAREAVVVVETAAVREGPAVDFKPAFEIHEGLKVRVVGVQDGFFRVRLPNGTEGWVASAEVPRV